MSIESSQQQKVQPLRECLDKSLEVDSGTINKDSLQLPFKSSDTVPIRISVCFVQYTHKQWLFKHIICKKYICKACSKKIKLLVLVFTSLALSYDFQL